MLSKSGRAMQGSKGREEEEEEEDLNRVRGLGQKCEKAVRGEGFCMVEMGESGRVCSLNC